MTFVMTDELLEAIKRIKNDKFSFEDANTINLINEPGEQLKKCKPYLFQKV